MYAMPPHPEGARRTGADRFKPLSDHPEQLWYNIEGNLGN